MYIYIYHTYIYYIYIKLPLVFCAHHFCPDTKLPAPGIPNRPKVVCLTCARWKSRSKKWYFRATPIDGNFSMSRFNLMWVCIYIWHIYTLYIIICLYIPWISPSYITLSLIMCWLSISLHFPVYYSCGKANTEPTIWGWYVPPILGNIRNSSGSGLPHLL